MAPSSKEKDITSLPLKGMWHVYVHKLRAWVAGDDGLPVRPYLMLVVSTEVGDLTQPTSTYFVSINIVVSERGGGKPGGPTHERMYVYVCDISTVFSPWVEDDFWSAVERVVMGWEYLVLYNEDGAFLACEPGETDDEAGGGNVVKMLPSSETVLAFLKRVMTHPRLMNTSKAGEKRAPARPKSIRFADTATAALHQGDKDKWAGETACSYVEGCRAGLAALGVDDCSFAPVPQQLIQDIIRGQIEPNMVWRRHLFLVFFQCSDIDINIFVYNLIHPRDRCLLLLCIV